jgi:hypothetical protein
MFDLFSFSSSYSEKDPYDGMNPTTVAVGVLRDNLRPRIPENVNEDYAQLMKDCWDRNPEVRPTFLEVVTRLKLMASSTSDSSHSKGTSTTSPFHFTNTSSSNTASSSSESETANERKLREIDNAIAAPVCCNVLDFVFC